ncbi:MAG: 2-oxo acid dehydrogenase subunit E2 [Clostridium sp.]|nr:2-oxo acid dehydrogenase subunit E2 [Clostridium sp.]
MALIKEEYFGIARKIVSNMTSESWESIPHATMTYDADVTELFAECKKLNKDCTDKSKKITINTVMLKILCEGFKAAPKMNTHLEFNRKLVRGNLKYFDHIDISMPMILPSGEMMTVNMHDMGDKSLSQMTDEINDTIRRAKNSDMNEVMFEVSLDNTLTGLKNGKILQTVRRLYGSKMPGKHKVKTLSGKAKKEYYSIPIADRLTKHDIEQGTTTISNLGSIYREQKGFCALLEIIPPQTTAIAINSAQKRPTVVTDENGNDKIETRLIMPLTIAIDHRALDYGDVVPFMRKLDEIFANPSIIQEWK